MRHFGMVKNATEKNTENFIENYDEAEGLEKGKWEN